MTRSRPRTDDRCATAESFIMHRCLALGVALSVLGFAPALRAQQTVPGTNALLFHSRVNAPDVVMMPRSSHVCFLTGLGGRLDEHAAVGVHGSTVDMSWVRLVQNITKSGGGTVLDDGFDKWKLGGWQDGSDINVFAEAICVPFSNFQMDPGGVTQVSPSNGATVSTPIGLSCDRRTSVADLWPGEAAPFIERVRGGFFGFSEAVSIRHGASASAPAQLVVTLDNCDVWMFEGSARSVRVGVPGTNLYPNYAAYMTSPTSADPQHRGEARLAPTASSVCFFTHVSGDFESAGDQARIVVNNINNQPWWVLHATAGTGKVEAKVACLSYDQHAAAVVGPDDPPSGQASNPGSRPDACRASTTTTGSVIRRTCPNN